MVFSFLASEEKSWEETKNLSRPISPPLCDSTFSCYGGSLLHVLHTCFAYTVHTHQNDTSSKLSPSRNTEVIIFTFGSKIFFILKKNLN